MNKDIPVEDVAACMGDLIDAGKIRGWGQSQATEDELRRAHAVTGVTAVQSEYSLMERMFETDVIPTCEELGIGFVTFSPLANGFLSGTASADTADSGDDVRRVITRFAPANVRANQPLLDLLTSVAREKGATPAQISLAWMLHKSGADVALTDAEFARIEAALATIAIHGNRTDEDIATLRSTD